MRALYFVEGSFLWWLFRPTILKNLKTMLRDIEETPALGDVPVVGYAFYYKVSKIKAWAIRRYMRRLRDCRPCFYQGSCVHCGCNVNKVFMSSMECDGKLD